MYIYIYIYIIGICVDVYAQIRIVQTRQVAQHTGNNQPYIHMQRNADICVYIHIDPGKWVPVSSPPEAEIPKLLKTKLFARS